MQPDYTLTNGRYELPTSARGVMIPIEHRGETRSVPIVVQSNGIRRRFTSFFRLRRIRH